MRMRVSKGKRWRENACGGCEEGVFLVGEEAGWLGEE